MRRRPNTAAANCKRGRGFLPIDERGGHCTRIYRLCSTDDVLAGRYSSSLRRVSANDVAHCRAAGERPTTEKERREIEILHYRPVASANGIGIHSAGGVSGDGHHRTSGRL